MQSVDYYDGGGGGGGPPYDENINSASSSNLPLGKKRRLSPASVNQDDDADVKPSKEKAGGASEFVKKLYRMLEDADFHAIVCWGNTGDSFVVKDMNAFTKDILPMHFKHSNFASFVRQLNKYDFHKVKNPEEGGNPYGEHTWEFKHPNFKCDMKDNLEFIKRKAPAPRKSTPTPTNRSRASAGPSPLSIDPSLSHPHPAGNLLLPQQHHQQQSHHPGMNGGDYGNLQSQIDNLHRTQQGMSQHMQNISQDYQVVMGEMMNFQRNLVAQDQLMQNLIQYLVNLEADQKAASNPSSTLDPSGPFVPSSQAQKLISSYTEVARASYDQLADLSRRASLSGGTLPHLPPPPPGFGHFDMNRRNNNQQPNGGGGGFDPRDQNGGGGYGGVRRDGPGPGNSLPPPPLQNGGQSREQQQRQHQMQHQQQDQQRQHQQEQQRQQDQQRQEQQRQQDQQRQQQQHSVAPPPVVEAPKPSPTHNSGWAVPPRVLLVEDDAVCRKLSSKFLQVFGCQIDVAEDGVSAVNKMNSAVEKYDLVLMDIVMPNLDGVSATSLIRQFDPMTPIISMTSNSGPNDIMTYFSHGMNDILPKPFTKEGLLGMLEKHLIHLKVMQQLSEIPRALGYSNDEIKEALVVSTQTDQGVMNPFSGLGLSDQEYLQLLQTIAVEKEGKRGLSTVQGDGEGTRSRFLIDGPM